MEPMEASNRHRSKDLDEVVTAGDPKKGLGDYVLQALGMPRNHSAMAHFPTTTPCPACGSRETFRVSMTLAGSPTSFMSCTVCEWKGWEREGEHLALNSVLALVSTR
jgi:hypothetical protein